MPLVIPHAHTDLILLQMQAIQTLLISTFTPKLTSANTLVVDKSRRIKALANSLYVQIWDVSGASGSDESGGDEGGGNMNQAWTMGISIHETFRVDAPDQIVTANVAMRTNLIAVRNTVQLFASSTFPVPPRVVHSSNVEEAYFDDENPRDGYPCEFAVELQLECKTFENYAGVK